jgi:hypothetical protein
MGRDTQLGVRITERVGRLLKVRQIESDQGNFIDQ